ncbi:MAG: glycosyltransferase family 9 protein [Desulfoplanes sp.]
MTKDISQIQPKRILICQLRQIGDVVLTTHIPELLKKRFPYASIDFFTEKKCAPVLANNPYISDIKILDKNKLANFAKELAFYWKIARNNYDLVIDFQQLPRCRFVVLFSRAAVRFTSSPPWYNRWLYTHWTKLKNGHPIPRKAKMLEPFGIVWNGERPHIFLTTKEQAEARALLTTHGVTANDILVTVAPTHHSATRRWPARHYGKLINLAVRENKRIKFVLFYGPGERACVEEVMATAQCPTNCILPKTMLSLRQMAAVIEKADLHFGNCSSPRHFAVALNTPSLTVIGAAGTGWTFDSPEHTDIVKNLPCQPCKQETCARGNQPCLQELYPDAVLPIFLKKIDIISHLEPKNTL